MKNSRGFQYGVPAVSSWQYHPSQKLYAESLDGATRFVWDPSDLNFQFKNREIITVFECDDGGMPTSRVLFHGPAVEAALKIGGSCTTDKF